MRMTGLAATETKPVTSVMTVIVKLNGSVLAYFCYINAVGENMNEVRQITVQRDISDQLGNEISAQSSSTK